MRALPAEPTIDLAYLDADKSSYPAYYDELVPRLGPGGVLAIDNVLMSGRILDPAEDDAGATPSLASTTASSPTTASTRCCSGWPTG